MCVPGKLYSVQLRPARTISNEADSRLLRLNMKTLGTLCALFCVFFLLETMAMEDSADSAASAGGIAAVLTAGGEPQLRHRGSACYG